MVGRISFEEMMHVDNEIIFSSNDGAGLYLLEKEDKKSKILTEYPQIPELLEDSYKVMAKVGNKFFLPNCFGEHIAVYDRGTGNYQMLKLMSLSVQQKDLHRFWTSIVYGDFIFFIGHYYPAIVKLDVHTMEMSYLTDWVEQIEKRRKLAAAPYLGIGIVEDNIATFPCCCTNAVLKLDLKTNETEVCEIPVHVDGMNGICSAGNLYWLTVRNGPETVIWNKDSDSVEVLEIESRKKYGGVPFAPPFIYQQKFYLFPYWADAAYCIDTFTKKIERINELDSIWDSWRETATEFSKILCPPAIVEGKIYFVTGVDKLWHIYDPVTKDVKCFPVYIDKSRQKAIKKKRALKDLCRAIRESNTAFLFLEEELFSGREYSEMIDGHSQEIEIFQSRNKALKESFGQKIYRNLK